MKNGYLLVIISLLTMLMTGCTRPDISELAKNPEALALQREKCLQLNDAERAKDTYCRDVINESNIQTWAAEDKERKAEEALQIEALKAENEKKRLARKNRAQQ